MTTKHFRKTSTGRKDHFGDHAKEVEFTHALPEQKKRVLEQDTKTVTSQKFSSSMTPGDVDVAGGKTSGVAEGKTSVAGGGRDEQNHRNVVSKMADLELL